MCYLPALWRISMFCGLVDRVATVCTNCTRDFWYCSKTVKHKETVSAREFLFLKESLHLNISPWMICRWLMFIYTKICRKNAVELRRIREIRSRFCSPAPGEVVWRRLGNRQEAGRSAAADKDRIHLQKWITLSLFSACLTQESRYASCTETCCVWQVSGAGFQFPLNESGASSHYCWRDLMLVWKVFFFLPTLHLWISGQMSPLFFKAFLIRTLYYVYYTTPTTNTKSQTYIIKKGAMYKSLHINPYEFWKRKKLLWY